MAGPARWFGLLLALCVAAQFGVVQDGRAGGRLSETVCPDEPGDFDFLFGRHLSGDALDLCDSDDVWLEFRHAATNIPVVPDLRVEVWANAVEVTDPSVITYTVELHATMFPPGNDRVQRMYIRNFRAGTWETIDERSNNPLGDEVIVHVQSERASDYIDPQTGEVRLRVDIHKTGDAAFLAWRLKIDRFEVTLEE